MGTSDSSVICVHNICVHNKGGFRLDPRLLSLIKLFIDSTVQNVTIISEEKIDGLYTVVLIEKFSVGE